MSVIKFTDKRVNIIVNKIGLTEEQANYCVKKHKKYAIWFANQIKDFNLDINSNDVDNEINRILTWKREVQEVNLNDLKFKEAIKLADKYFNSLFVKTSKSLKNKNVVLDCGDYKWVQLKTVDDCIEEGKAMGHCIGNDYHSKRIANKNSVSFSLRDKYNKPHLTLEALFNEEKNEFGNIFEFKGSQNQIPNIEYSKYFVKLLEKYNFKSYTDINLKNSLEKSFDVVKEINSINSSFFPIDVKVSMGLNCFGEYKVIIDKINIKSGNTINLPKGLKFYTNINIESKEIIISENILFGGNVFLSSDKISIGENVKIAGNLEIKRNKTLKTFKNNIIVFGDILVPNEKVEKKVKKSIICEGNIIPLYVKEI